MSQGKFCKKTTGIFCCLFFAYLLYLPGPGLCKGEGQRLSLQDAFKYALEHNPVILKAVAQEEKAHAHVFKSISAFLPKLNVELGYTRSNNPVKVFSDKLNQADFKASDFDLDILNNPGYRSAWQARFIMTQPVFNQGREIIGYKTSRILEEMSGLGLKGAGQDVLFNVERSYCQALLAREKVNVLEAALQTALSHERLAGKRYETGLVLKSDVLSARVQRSSIERELFKARSDYKIAMAALNRAMGLGQDNVWELSLLDNEKKEPGALDVLIAKAKRFRPEFLLARDKAKISSYMHKQAMFRFLPSINLHGIYQSDRENLAYFGGDSWMFMATVSMNIFNGFGDKANLDEASAEVRRARAGLEEAAQAIELEVRKAYYDFLTAKKQLRVARESVSQARESQKILKNRYGNGLALMVELLAADTNVKMTMLEEAKARFDARLSWSRLKRKVGILGKDVLEQELSKDHH